MASVTVSGGGSTPLFFRTSTPLQTALAQQILGAALNVATSELTTALFTGGIVTGIGGAITAASTVDLSSSVSTLTGTSSIPIAQVALDGQDGIYITGTTNVSTVVAADNSNSSIVNDHSSAALLAGTGAGGNVLLGLAGANNFTTGFAGQDIVLLSGASNSLTSNGSEAVLVGGSSTITSAASGIVNVALTSGTTLDFINGSRPGAIDSIMGSAGGTVVVAGYGASSITSGTGAEAFYVDTSSGNVTLNGNLSGGDVFEFVKNLNTASGLVAVNNFAPTDSIYIHGYNGSTVSAATGNPSGSMLQLSDGSQINFSNVSSTLLQQTIKIV